MKLNIDPNPTSQHESVRNTTLDVFPDGEKERSRIGVSFSYSCVFQSELALCEILPFSFNFAHSLVQPSALFDQILGQIICIHFASCFFPVSLDHSHMLNWLIQLGLMEAAIQNCHLIRHT